MLARVLGLNHIELHAFYGRAEPSHCLSRLRYRGRCLRHIKADSFSDGRGAG